MTLHEAILEVLKDNRNAQSAEVVANEVNGRGLYIKADGKPVSVSQILLRAKKYPRWFSIADSHISLKVGNDKILKNYFTSLVDIYRRRGNSDFLDALKLFFYLRINADSLNYLSRRDILSTDINLLKNDVLLNDLQRINSSEELEGVFDEVIRTIQNAEVFEISETLNFLTGINLTRNVINDSEFNSFFIATLKQLLTRQRRSLSLPDFASKFIYSIIPRESAVYVPFGELEVFNWLLDDQANNNLREYFFQTGDSNVYEFGKVLRFLLNSDQQIRLVERRDYSEVISQEYKIDTCFSIIPTGNSREMASNSDFNLNSVDELSYHTYLIKNIAEKISNGKMRNAYLVIPDSFLFSTKKADIDVRKSIIGRNIVKTVISLPEKLFYPYSSLKQSLLVLSNDNLETGIYFINAKHLSATTSHSFSLNIIDLLDGLNSSDIEYELVDNHWVSSNNYSLVVENYINRNIELIKQISSPEYIEVEELIRGYIKGRHYSVSETTSDGSKIPLIRTNSLSDETGGLKINLDSVDRFVSKDDLDDVAKHTVPKNSILIATRGNLLKATLFDLDQSVLLSSNMLAISPNENVILPEFFLIQLKADYFFRQVESIRNRSVISYFTIGNFLKLKIRVPSFQEQQIVVSEYKSDVLSQIQNVIKEKTESSKEGELKIFRAFKHELGNRSSELNNYLQTLQLYITQVADKKELVDLDKAIYDDIEAPTLTELFNSIFGAQEKISSTFRAVQNVFDFQNNEGNKVVTNLNSFVHQECTSHKLIESKVEKIIFLPSPKFDPIIDIDKNQFSVLLENFIRNGEMHGSLWPNRIKFVIGLEYQKETNLILLHVINNGLRLPEGFTIDEFTSFGLKSGTTGNTGIGGYLIKLIVDNHRGKLRLGILEDWLRFTHSRSIKGSENFDPLFKPSVHFVVELNV